MIYQAVRKGDVDIAGRFYEEAPLKTGDHLSIYQFVLIKERKVAESFLLKNKGMMIKALKKAEES